MTGSNCDSKYYFSKGLENSEMANYDLAVRDFSEAIALDPGNAEAYRNRGKAVLHGGFTPLMPYMKGKDYRNAIADFSHAIVLNPSNAAAYLDRGMAFLWRGEHRLLHRWEREIIKMQSLISATPLTWADPRRSPFAYAA